MELQSAVPPAALQCPFFGIRCYLCSIEDLARVEIWGKRLHRVLRDLHPDIADYKGTTRYREMAVAYLAPIDDGAALPTARRRASRHLPPRSTLTSSG